MQEEILLVIVRNCAKHQYEKNTISLISEQIKVSRNKAAMAINELVETGHLIRVNSKPYIYLATSYLRNKGIEVTSASYSSLDDVWALANEEKKDFEKLVGYNHSLKNIVKQCKATISYPPNGLPMMLYGPTGTGKSYIAKLTYEWARNHGILDPAAKFVTVNCSEYANNPELLTANLFGHIKGAFTGAEKDNEGLLALADKGVLFLDEVHELKAECQEKLFLFMDQGIYHRVGDNDKWYKSDVRIIFATTEQPEKVLLKTLLRRIPMFVTIPSLSQRGMRERIELMYDLFSKEEKRLGCSIEMSNKVYRILLSAKMPGNIGELKSVIQSCCINSLFEREENDLVIRMESLPGHLLDQVYTSTNLIQEEEYIHVEDLKGFYDVEKGIIRLNQELLDCFKEFQKNRDHSLLMKKGKLIVEDYLSLRVYKQKETPEIEYYRRGIEHIFELVEGRYGFKTRNSDRIALAMYLDEIHHDYHDFRQWSLRHEEECEDFLQYLEQECFRATNVSLEICTYLKSYLEMDIYPILIISYIFYVYNLNKDQRLAQKACVVLAHGFSTASSIADAANRFLESYIFDAIDMPLYIDTAMITDKLNSYLSRIGKIKELYLLVDMGSLSDIYKGLHVENVDIGLINNVSTPMALELGSAIRQGLSMEDVFSQTAKQVESSLSYHIEQNHSKTPIILCSCASGMGTAKKLRMMIEDLFPEGVHLEVHTQDYNELLSKGKDEGPLSEYQIICIIGTLNPNVDGLPFVGIEDLIINENLEKFNSYFKDYMSSEQIEIFNKNVLRNFTLSNIMNNLTILNPSKLLEQVADAIDQLQTYLQVQLKTKTCFGMYVHICCLIERLVVAKKFTEYKACEDFVEQHSVFIDFTKKAFHKVENFYGVDIPLEEIAYIYDYVKND